jgi:hypothetical protein
VPVPIQENEKSCICVLGVSILPLSMIFFIRFWKCSEIVVFFVFSFYCMTWVLSDLDITVVVLRRSVSDLNITVVVLRRSVSDLYMSGCLETFCF